MPGEKSLELQQYYGNRQNQFWKLLFAVTETPFSDDYGARMALLKEKHIALWDVLASCRRDGSLDSKIKDAIPNDFDSFYNSYPNIRRVYFSSKAAANFYDRFVGRKSDREYYVLPSPSGANASMTFLQKLEAWAILRNILE